MSVFGIIKKEVDLAVDVRRYSSTNLESIRSRLNDKNLSEIAEEFYEIVRCSFAKIFEMDEQFTFEEIIMKIKNMDVILKQIDNELNEIEKKIDEVYKKEKKIDVIKQKVLELKEKFNKLLEKEKRYIYLINVLEQNNLIDDIKSLCTNTSKIKYSNEKISKESLESLFDKFEDIIDILTSKNIAAKEELKKTEKVFSLIEQTKELIRKGSPNEAKQKYVDILKEYSKLEQHEKKLVYNELNRIYQKLREF